MRLGEYQELEVARETDHGVYLTDSEEEVLLPRGQVPSGTSIGDRLRVFLLTDSEDRPVATTKKPLATVGEFAKLRVVAVTPAGAFLDWGLDKDLFCAKREQPSPMREGSEYVVRVYLDEVSQRVACSARLNKYLVQDGLHLRQGQAVKIMVAAKTPDLIVVIIDGQTKGSLFPDEWRELLQLGDVRDAFVKNVRPEDGKVAVSLRPQGFRALVKEGDRVMDALKQAGGFLPLTDKSPPVEIERQLGLSKGAFKRLIGNLYKEGCIELEPGGIRLKA